MRLLVTFAATLVLGLGAVVGLTRWVDPFGFFYEDGVVGAALGRQEPCLIADDVVGEASWLSFKLDLVGRRGARVVAIGSSRALKLRSRQGESGFVNVGLPGIGIESLEPLFHRLRQLRPGPLTVYVGVELFWLNRTWTPSTDFDLDLRQEGRYLFARQNFSESVSLIRKDPSTLFHRWWIERIGSRCVVTRGPRARAGRVNAWEVDGSFRYAWEFAGTAKPAPDDEYGRDLARFEGVYYRDWRELDPARLEVLARALDLARSYGWRVVGFAPPYSSRYVARLSSAPETAARWSEFGDVVPQLFRARGFPFLDLRAGREVPCRDREYVDDGWHPSDACAARVRRRLDAAAAP